ncbi:hypothetical protein [Mesorhizobium sp. M1406]|uniref:hypothetical protein n=1 Tax=Mesorhizobium sp. M1406 TaxID=2957099 RepID=UPI00333CD726
MTNPYAIKLRDGRVVSDLDWANASDQVKNYDAEWLSYDSALAAISVARAGTRKPTVINARVEG